eukprot:9874098-Alexandrium_andersonii.AAC.1
MPGGLLGVAGASRGEGSARGGGTTWAGFVGMQMKACVCARVGARASACLRVCTWVCCGHTLARTC